jgi:1-deoxy-D-xylulose-5-phosphate synthase
VAVLERISGPADLRGLTPRELADLAAEIRDFLVDRVARTGGHLGPNLGVVELTIALHRVFDSPRDFLLWDTGHQAYVHKILTGRREEFTTLRQAGGLSGYPCRAESAHDHIENSHASTALCFADGVAKGLSLAGTLGEHHVVAVIGDGALTGGMAWEALNNIAGSDRQVIIVVNDNCRSYAPTIGGLAAHLDGLRTAHSYERMLDWGKDVLGRTPLVGPPMFEALHGIKEGLKDVLAPQGMFEGLGIKYLGPVSGHDIEDLERALRAAKGYPGPVIVHAITEKGHGYGPAEDDEADHLHGIGVYDPQTGRPLGELGRTWTDAFATEMVELGGQHPELVAITAAMLAPTGLAPFAEQFPERTFDVGIAEQHAAASAAGLARVGYHPVVAVYATFLNRAFDQVLMDVGLHRAGVTFVLDRAGVTGDDGASHNGMWDMAVFSVVPGLQLAAPRDEATLVSALRRAVTVSDAPTLVRYPKGALPPECPAITSIAGVDMLATPPQPEVLLVGVGTMAQLCLEAAGQLGESGISAAVAAPVWVKPVPEGLAEVAREVGLVVVVEDGIRVGGIAALVALALADAGCPTPVRGMGVPAQYLAQGRRSALMAAMGLTATGITESVTQWLALRGAGTGLPA